jgi:hypothetical protein
MNVTAQQTEFLSWKVVPARLDATQAAWFLGFEPHEIPRLVTAGLLKPLGHPARNSTKFFATETLEQFRRDEKWLARASDAIASYWRERNAHKAASAQGKPPLSKGSSGMGWRSLRISRRDQRSLRSATGPSLTSLWPYRLSPRALVTACKAHKSAGLPSGCWLASFHCGSAPRRLRSTPAPQQPDRSTDYPHFSPSGANGRVLSFTRLSNLCSSQGLCGGSAVASSAR